MIATTEVEVRYAETDQMGVVYHANYLVWMEIGRSALLRAIGYEYAALELRGYLAPVLDLSIRYKAPLRYGETAVIHTWVIAHGRMKTTYGYRIERADGTVAVEARSVHALVKKETFRPVSLSRIDPVWDAKYAEIARGE